MSEWIVVTVIVTIIGLVATIVTPIIRLNTTIIKLTTTVDVMQSTLKELTTDNSESHRRIWQHSSEQDEKLSNHDRRLHVIEENRSV